MKSDVRVLPHLNQLYLQKKSYQIHRKKIQSIKRSNSFSKKSNSSSRLFQNQQQSVSQLRRNQVEACNALNQEDRFDIMQDIHMETIEQAKPGLAYWMKKMNPLQKRIKQEQIKENKRLRQRIKNSTAFITTKNQISSHNDLFEGMKKRLTKFASNQATHKTALKCQMVLEKMDKAQKQRLRTQQSRIKVMIDQRPYVKPQSKFTIKQQTNRTISSLQLRELIDKKKQALLGESKQKSTLPLQNKQQLQNKSVNLKTSATIQNKTITSIKSNIILKKQPIKALSHTSNKSLSQLSRTQTQKNQKQVKIPNIIKHDKLRRLTTEPSQSFNLNRNSNTSKLSKFSLGSNTPKLQLNDYKLYKMNNSLKFGSGSVAVNQQNSRNFSRGPTVRYEFSYNRPTNRQKLPLKQDNSSSIQQKKGQLYRNARLKTQTSVINRSMGSNSYGSYNASTRLLRNNTNKSLNKVEQSPTNNRYDFQRKRIQRFLNNKSPVAMNNQNIHSKKSVNVLPRLFSKENKQISSINLSSNRKNSVQIQEQTNLKKTIQSQKVVNQFSSNNKNQSFITQSIHLQDSKQKNAGQKIENTNQVENVSYFATQIQ